jgi:hypothetical protein
MESITEVGSASAVPRNLSPITGSDGFVEIGCYLPRGINEGRGMLTALMANDI